MTNPDLLPVTDIALERERALVIPVVAEELHVTTRIIETAVVQVHKKAQEYQETVDPSLVRETVTVETVEVNRFVEGPIPTERQVDDIRIIPVLEEVLVVEKRMFLKAEIHIRRVQETFHAPQSVTLRREEVTVERHEAVPEADTVN